MKVLSVLLLLSLSGSMKAVEVPVEAIIVEPYQGEWGPAEDHSVSYGPGCIKIPPVSFQWENPVVPEVWASDPEIPELEYCGETVEGLRICCPDK